MNEEELINFLKENLKIELSTYCDGGIDWAENISVLLHQDTLRL